MKTLLSLQKLIGVALACALIAACSGGSGQQVTSNVNPVDTNTDTGVVYNGPSPSTDDVQNFKLNVWDKLAGTDRCGSCHVAGKQEPSFVRADDINLAYAEANKVIDLSAPVLSRMVTKVGEGHNCWRPEASVCADTITNYIQAWANASGAAANTIVLTPPPVKDVGSSKSFPADSAGFAATVYPITHKWCVNCHNEDAQQKQQPFFASDDVDVAYQAAKAKMNLDDAAASRFVVRLGEEFHNCWGNCASNAAEMQAAIQAFSDGIQPTEVDPNLVVSHSLGIPDGIVASSGGRFESNVIALYQFKKGSGTVAYDTSGVEPPLDLNLIGDVNWVGNWGIRVNDGKAQGSTASSAKLHDLISSTGEYSVEAWVVPDNVAQDGPARIITYSGGSDNRNFTVGQTLYNYNFMARSSMTDANGMPMLSTADADEVLQATLQHVVVNFDPISGRSIYVNGVEVANDPTPPGNLNDWDDTFALAIGEEVDNDKLWKGTVRLLAIHNRVLSPDEILQNFDAGVGEKFYLMFGVSDLIDMPDAYVVFQVQQFDDYSYLFDKPFFISLDDTATPSSDIVIKGIRIGVNGKEAPLGQSFARVDTTINSGNYNAETGVALSPLGAIIPLDKGPDADQFFLTFDQIGSNTYNRPADPVPPASAGADLPQQSDIALRNFGEINATLSAVTTVPETTPSVAVIYDTVKQQLPTTESLDTFVAANQAGVMQLAVAYCSALVADNNRRQAYFPGFDFSANYATAFTTTGRNQIIQPLMKALLAANINVNGTPTALVDQPVPADFEAELNNLIDGMSNAGTSTTVIATCASAVGNAVMLLQ